MSHFYAEFTSPAPSVQERRDTRVYFHSSSSHSQGGRNCKGVVWMCNPGSATASVPTCGWGPINSDPTLNAILRLYQDAVTEAKKTPEQDDYVAVLNCFYTCDANVVTAFEQWVALPEPHGELIPAGAGFVLAAWGADKPYGVVAESITRIEAFSKPVFFHDPMEPPTKPFSTSFKQGWFQAHPLNPSFRANSLALAKAIAPFL